MLLFVFAYDDIILLFNKTGRSESVEVQTAEIHGRISDSWQTRHDTNEAKNGHQDAVFCAARHRIGGMHCVVL